VHHPRTRHSVVGDHDYTEFQPIFSTFMNHVQPNMATEESTFKNKRMYSNTNQSNQNQIHDVTLNPPLRLTISSNLSLLNKKITNIACTVKTEHATCCDIKGYRQRILLRDTYDRQAIMYL
jgi:hypothetical protein